MTHTLPRQIDTVIVGNGPSALILSYILHGNIPEYDHDSPHPDPILHDKLKNSNELLSLDIDYLTQHFIDSRFSYSTQALPVNVLFDTLNRPFGETDEGEKQTSIRWRHDSRRKLSHIVVGNSIQPGGQWSDNPVRASLDIGALSYAGMLSLPGYTFEDYFIEEYRKPLAFCSRPARREITKYLSIYPKKVGIDDTLFNGIDLSGICRSGNGFYIQSHNIKCQNLVLASGTFTNLIAPRPLLQPLLKLKITQNDKDPLLIIGSGFSAADVIISTPPDRKIIHIYKWSPSTAPSPLRACHQQAYPEYAGVYKKMKLAAISQSKLKEKRPSFSQRRPSQFDLSRNWDENYEGLPNTAVISVRLQDTSAEVMFQHGDEEPFTRTIGGLAYVVGRRGSLDYLDEALRNEICPLQKSTHLISGQSLRGKAVDDLEVAANVFIIGNLTGDSLIRFAYGGCAYVAGRLFELESGHLGNSLQSLRQQTRTSSKIGTPVINAMNGLDGHEQSPKFSPVNDIRSDHI